MLEQEIRAVQWLFNERTIEDTATFSWNRIKKHLEESCQLPTTIPGSEASTQISALVESTIDSLQRGCGPNMWDFLEDLQKLLVS